MTRLERINLLLSIADRARRWIDQSSELMLLHNHALAEIKYMVKHEDWEPNEEFIRDPHPRKEPTC